LWRPLEENDCPGILPAKEMPRAHHLQSRRTGKQEGKLIVTDNTRNSPQKVLLIGHGEGEQ
jgi:hypothetical protein